MAAILSHLTALHILIIAVNPTTFCPHPKFGGKYYLLCDKNIILSVIKGRAGNSNTKSRHYLGRCGGCGEPPSDHLWLLGGGSTLIEKFNLSWVVPQFRIWRAQNSLLDFHYRGEFAFDNWLLQTATSEKISLDMQCWKNNCFSPKDPASDLACQGWGGKSPSWERYKGARLLIMLPQRTNGFLQPFTIVWTFYNSSSAKF